MRTATVGKILGAIGLLLLLTSPLTYFLTSGSMAFTVTKLGVAAVFMGAFFATNFRDMGQFASGRATFFVVTSVVAAVLTLALLGGVNYVAHQRNKTWDFTSKKLHTLAPQSVQTVKGLKEKVTALAFVTPTNPDVEFFRDLFDKFRTQAPDRFDFRFEDPAKNPELARRYNLREGQNTIVLVRGSGEKESSQTLQALSERDLTNALIKFDQVGNQKVYFLHGHGEWPLEPQAQTQEAFGSSLSELMQSLQQEGAVVESLPLLERKEVPRDAALVIIAGAQTPLAEGELTSLGTYLDEGGRLVFLPDARADVGLDALLAKYGLQVDAHLVADQLADRTPYNPVTMSYSQHEVTALLQEAQLSVRFATVRGLSILHEGTLPGVKAEPLVLSSPYAWEESTPDGEPSPSEGEKSGAIPLAALSRRSVSDPAVAANNRFDEARVLVIGDADIVTNRDWGHTANQNFVLNALAWTRNQSKLVTIRPPEHEVSSLDLDDAMLDRLRFVVTDVFPVTLLALGLGIWLSRRDK